MRQSIYRREGKGEQQVCVCVCVCEREREREREREGGVGVHTGKFRQEGGESAGRVQTLGNAYW